MTDTKGQAGAPWMQLDDNGAPDRAPFFEPERALPGTGAPQPASASRRGFLKALGLSAASLSACQRLPVRHAMPYLVPPEEITPGIPTYYASTCGVCPSRCGMLVKVLDGRPVKLEGNPDDSLSGGGLCAIGQAQLRELYDPGRLQRPTIDGTPATWNDVDRQVGEALRRAAQDGGRVYVVSRSITSPATRSAVSSFLEPYGGVLVEHDLDPQAPSALAEAYELLDGRARLPAPDLLHVDVLVSLAADPFGSGPDPVANVAAWSAKKRLAEDDPQVAYPRHIQIEGSLSLSGANADERWPATAAERELTALWLLRLVAERRGGETAAALLPSLATPPAAAVGVDRLARLADDLVAHVGHSVVISSANRPAEQLAVALINRILGNEATTLRFDRPDQPVAGRDGALIEFRDNLLAGRAGAVFFLGLDLCAALPEGDALVHAIRELPLSVGVFMRPNPTASACRMAVAAHHPLESWSDAEVRVGRRRLAQPTIRPLFDTRDPGESFLRWAGEPGEWRDHVRGQWLAELGEPGTDLEAYWTDMVRSAGLGEWAGEAAPDETAAGDSQQVQEEVLLPAQIDAVVAALRGDAGQGGSTAAQVEVEIVAGVGQRGGDHAHNPWLRELPDPLTRVSWTPCVRIAPQRAEELGVGNGDVVMLTGASGAVSLPVVLLPGQHRDTVTVPLGLPVSELADEEGSADISARLLEYSADGRLSWSGMPASLEPTGDHVELPLIQVHAKTEGRPIVHQVAAADDEVHAPHHPEASLWPVHPKNSPQWGMVIDLNACVGCGGCVVACQVENNIPVVGPELMVQHRDMHWLRIDRYFVGDDAANPDVLFEPMLCAHCDNAPCETVCPVAATVHSADGLNQQVYNRCVGTRYCANNCPYKVRRFNWFNFQPTDPVERMALNPDVVVRSRGVMEKCTFCTQRIQASRIAARKEGVPTFEVRPACEQSCPAQAISFGDATDRQGEIVRLRGKGRAFQVLAELGVQPSVSYLAKVRHREGLEGEADTHDAGAGGEA